VAVEVVVVVAVAEVEAAGRAGGVNRLRGVAIFLADTSVDAKSTLFTALNEGVAGR